jgi:hypothetical protein
LHITWRGEERSGEERRGEERRGEERSGEERRGEERRGAERSAHTIDGARIVSVASVPSCARPQTMRRVKALDILKCT